MGRRGIRVLLAGLVLGLLTAVPAHAKRVALVIGNAAYTDIPPLANPVNDARLIGGVLTGLGFDTVLVHEDVDIHGMEDALIAFAEEASGAEIAIFYFAGHGMQAGGQNYLFPVDADPPSVTALARHSFTVDEVLGDYLARANVREALVILDACRDSRLYDYLQALEASGRSTAPALTRGFAPASAVTPAGGFSYQILFSTGDGQVADDGPAGSNSPFTAALAASLAKPGLATEDLLREVRSSLRAQGLGQTPINYGILDHPLVLNLAPATDALAPGATEIAAWQAVMASTDPADFAAFLAAHPDGLFAGAARLQLEALSLSSPSNRPPSVAGLAAIDVTAGSAPSPLAIPAPTDPDADPLSIAVLEVPSGVEILSDGRRVAAGDDLSVGELAALSYAPTAARGGSAGRLRFRVDDAAGGQAMGSISFRIVAPSYTPAQLRALEAGWSGEERLRVQRDLQAAGYYRGAIDGLFGPATRSAIQAFQASLQVEETGYLPPHQVAALTDAAYPYRTFRDCGDCPEMVTIPEGSFTMGSPATEAGREESEGPQHRVTLPGFSIGRFEVTRGEFAAFVAATGYRTDGGCWFWNDQEWELDPQRSWRDPGYGYVQGETEPVTCVSWTDARAYAEWLAAETGHRYRLPSEAEWEYAVRAGTSAARYWGDGLADACAHANIGEGTTPCSDGHELTAPAGAFAPNAFGLSDMLGNVWEWTADCWNDSYGGAPDDGRPWESGDCDQRVERGGSWSNDPRFARSAARIWDQVDFRDVDAGFRVARDR